MHNRRLQKTEGGPKGGHPQSRWLPCAARGVVRGIIQRPGRNEKDALLLKTKGVGLWAGSLKRRPWRRYSL